MKQLRLPLTPLSPHQQKEYWIIEDAWFWLSYVCMGIGLVENLGNCDFIHAILASYISFLSRGYVLKPLPLQVFLKIKEYLSSYFRRSNHSDSQSCVRRFDQICSLFPSSMCFLAVIHSTGPDVIRTVSVRVLCCL